LGEKGLRDLDRSTRFLCTAAKMALHDANMVITPENTDRIGVCTGTTLSSLWGIAEFNRQIIKDGPLFTDVGLFPGTVINAASSKVSILFNIQGFNTTISNGYTSSIDALKYAIDFIQFDRADAVLVSGVESLAFVHFAGFSALEFLAGIKGEEVSCPFDKRRNGIILGEGAVVLTIESEEHALKRKARIYAAVSSTGSYFDAYRSGKYQPQAKGLCESMREAITKAKLNTNDIDYICSSANSVNKQDSLETLAIKEVFGKQASKKPINAIKSMIGETFSASGLFQIASVVGGFEQKIIPPTINYCLPDADCDLDYVTNAARKNDAQHVLVTNFGPGGNNATTIISKFN